MLSVFEWFVLVLQYDAFVVIVLSDEPRLNQGRGLVNRKQLKPPPPPRPTHLSNFIAGRPGAALLFWFFGGFRCGVWLFFFLLVLLDIKLENM